MTKVLVATDKPFAAIAVKGIREVVEAAGYELALLEKYTDKASQKAGIFSSLLLISVCHMSFSYTILTSYFQKVKCPFLFWIFSSI